MAKRARRRVPYATEIQFRMLRRELKQIQSVLAHNADVLDSVQRDCATNLRRCAELQADVDSLHKALKRR